MCKACDRAKVQKMRALGMVGRPVVPMTLARDIAKAKGNNMTAAPSKNEWSGPRFVPWYTGHDNAPITESTKWEDPRPNGGTWIDDPVSRVLKFLRPNGMQHGAGWGFLEGWNQSERVEMIKKWIKSTWSTPWAMIQTLPEAEEEFGILFIAWALGWNVSFGGKKIQVCWLSSEMVNGQRGPSGYRWNPFTRSCEKIPVPTVKRAQI